MLTCRSEAEVSVEHLVMRGLMIYYQDQHITLYHGDCREILPTLSSVDLIIMDPPYKEGYENIFPDLKKSLSENGSLIWFVQPTELFCLPEIPKQVLIWEEPPSPKPIRKKYCEFLDFIAWYAYGNYTFNPLLWNLMNSHFNDKIIRANRLHKWEKPESLIERLLLVHSNIGNLIVDPFMGSGTSLLMARKLKRKSIGIDTDEKSCEIAAKRMAQEVLF